MFKTSNEKRLALICWTYGLVLQGRLSS